jgi:hypothetical protein
MFVKIMDIYPDNQNRIVNCWELKLIKFNVNSGDCKITLTLSTSESMPIIEQWFNQIIDSKGIFRDNQQYAKKALVIIDDNGNKRVFNDVLPENRILPTMGVSNLICIYGTEVISEKP